MKPWSKLFQLGQTDKIPDAGETSIPAHANPTPIETGFVEPEKPMGESASEDSPDRREASQAESENVPEPKEDLMALEVDKGEAKAGAKDESATSSVVSQASGIPAKKPGKLRKSKPSKKSGSARPQTSNPAPSEEKIAGLVSALLEDKDPEAALRETTRGLEQYPDSANLLALKGEACLRLKQPAEAEEAFRQALAKNPRLVAAFEGLARASEKAKDWEKALTRWQSCLDNFSSHPEASNWAIEKANALLELGRYKKAEKLFSELAAQYRDRPTIHAGLAKISTLRQNWQEAIERWQSCLEQFPKHKHTAAWRDELANILVKLGRFEDAEKQYQALLDEDRNSIDAHESLAGLAETQGRFSLALEHYRDCLSVFPKHPKAKRWRAKIGGLLVKLGKLDAAKSEYQALADQFPDYHVGRKGLLKVSKERNRIGKQAGSGD